MNQARADSLKDNISTYRYRYTAVLIAFVVPVILIVLLYRMIIGVIDLPSGFATLMSAPELIIWFIVLILALITLAIYAVRLLLYSVCIDKTSVKIIIRGFSTKSFLLNEIATVKLIIRLNGCKDVFVKLVNGKKYSFDNSLKNFPELFYILKEHCPA